MSGRIEQPIPVSSMPTIADQPGLDIDVAGETLRLLPGRAVHWPDRATLLVADAHFGKAASFRAHGVPVPHGTTTETLDRLDALIDSTQAQRVVFLGDLLHSRKGRVEATLDAVTAWRQRRADVALTLVRGNHDAHAGDPPPAWEIEVVPEPFAIGPLRLCHHPDCAADGYVLAGHLHPAIILRGRANERVRLACYWFGDRVGVLPAFGSFTGSAIILPAAGDRVFGIAGEVVVPIPVVRGSGSLVR